MTGEGRIITFYSYKGGTGRSMALANVAWILASNGRKVLAIDWDLEAPGLHRYFRPFLIDPELSHSPGLINFIWSYAADAMTPTETNQAESLRWEHATDLNTYTVQLDWEFPGDGCIDLICAGQQDAKYAELVNSFDWTNLYRRLDGELLFSELRRRFKSDYDFTLIDSRTGVSDTSGICTIAMPDSIAAFYTLNRQSVVGVAAVLDSIQSQRGDGFSIFPIVTRVELAEKERLEAARKRMRALFQKFIESGDGSSSRDYWADAEILYQPYYAYEEMLAAFGDPTGSERSPTSLLAAMEKLTSRITGIAGIEMPLVPETKRREILGQFAGTERKDMAESESREDPAERRDRAERYIEKDLDKPDLFFVRRARIERARSTLTAMVVFGSVVSSILFTTYYVYSTSRRFSVFMSLALIFEVCGAGSKLFEITAHTWGNDYEPQARKSFSLWFRHNSKLMTLLLFLVAFGCFVAGTFYEVSKSPVFLQFAALTTSIFGCIAQGWALVGRFDEKMARFSDGSQSLKREVRAYAQGLGRYSEAVEPHEAWKRFVETAEAIVASAPDRFVSDSVAQIARQLTSQEKLAPTKAREIGKLIEDVWPLRLGENDTIETVSLDKVEEKMRSKEPPFERLPILSATGVALMVVHRSMLNDFLLTKKSAEPTKKAKDYKLSDLVAEYPWLKKNSFATIPPAALAAEAKAAMEQKKGCLDVFVTLDGTPVGIVTRWITNVDLLQAAQV